MSSSRSFHSLDRIKPIGSSAHLLPGGAIQLSVDRGHKDSPLSSINFEVPGQAPVDGPKLLVGVLSRHSDRSRREAIRQTWGSSFKSPDWKLLFVVGRTTGTELRIEAESRGDMIIV